MAAKVAYFGALMAAADYEQDGALTLRSGPLTPNELAEDLLLSRAKSDLAVRELVHAGFLLEANGTLSIAKWDEKAGENSTHRVRKHREKHRLETLHETVSETLQVTQIRNAPEKEEEKETEVEPLRGTRAEDDFSDFLLDEGVRSGAIGEHRTLDRAAWRHSNRDSAKVLLDTYGMDQCKSKARLMFAAWKSGKIRRSLSYPAAALVQMWEYRELGGIGPASHADPLLDEFRSLG